ncbi:unnamed protein product [Gongylonema pulchrum]|uniref:MIF4G_like_2 domain-containing protein n=1 Tax=Gongylonema pulchrum TaxID=637853 RepID=A0A183CZL1_9BILA|nr:unnamed protein product [Gongylonema pulchrum]
MGVTLVEELPFAHVVDARYADRAECAYLSRVAPRVPETIPRLIGRIITKLRRDGDTHAAFNGRLFSSLKSRKIMWHWWFADVDDVEKDEKKRTGFAMIMHVMKDYFVPAKFPSKQEIFEIFCKILINVLVVTDNCLNEIGKALYLGLSGLDHSCNPDAFVIFNGSKATLRSLKDDVTQYSDKVSLLLIFFFFFFFFF